jgi:transposase
MAFLGLVPSEQSSGNRRHQGGITKTGNRLVGRGKSSQVAVTAVARELAGFVWGLMVDRVELHKRAA